MWVSRISRTSASAMPLPVSRDFKPSNVVDGPGSISATPPGDCRIAVAMICGRPRKFRSTKSMPDARVAMVKNAEDDDGGGPEARIRRILRQLRRRRGSNGRHGLLIGLMDRRPQTWQ